MRAVLSVLLVTALSISPNLAGATTNQQPLRLQVVTENWYPFNYLDLHGQVIGRSTKAVRHILEDANISYDISLNSWERSYNLARTRENVLLYSVLRTPAREKLFHWFCPISETAKHSVYKLASRKDIQVAENNDLFDYSINLTRGTFAHEYFVSKGMKEGKNLQLTSTNKANVLMLFKGRVDLIIEAELAIESIVKEAGFRMDQIEKVHTFSPHEQAQTCMALSKQTHPELINKVRTAHQKFIRSHQPL